jgi:chromosome transmission fidelity protein 1
MSDYEQHLLSYLASSKIMTLSCGHVIPPTNLLAIPVTQTLTGVDFDFTFEKRKSEKMVGAISFLIKTRHIEYPR